MVGTSFVASVTFFAATKRRNSFIVFSIVFLRRILKTRFFFEARNAFLADEVIGIDNMYLSTKNLSQYDQKVKPAYTFGALYAILEP